MSVNADRLALITTGVNCDVCGRGFNPLIKAHRVVERGEVKVRHVTCPEALPMDQFSVGDRVRLARPPTVNGTPDRLVRVGTEGTVAQEWHTNRERYPRIMLVVWDDLSQYWLDRECIEHVPPPVRRRQRITLTGEHESGRMSFRREHQSRTQPRDSRGRFARTPRAGDRVMDNRPMFNGRTDVHGTVVRVNGTTARVSWDAGHTSTDTPLGWLDVLR